MVKDVGWSQHTYIGGSQPPVTELQLLRTPMPSSCLHGYCMQVHGHMTKKTKTPLKTDVQINHLHKRPHPLGDCRYNLHWVPTSPQSGSHQENQQQLDKAGYPSCQSRRLRQVRTFKATLSSLRDIKERLVSQLSQVKCLLNKREDPGSIPITFIKA